MSRKNEKAEEEAQAIDLTPMLDVVFIMLIFFIVTATFIKETGIEVTRPEATTAEEKPDAAILVAVNANNEIWIDNQQIDPRGVRAQIERLQAENPRGTVVVQADSGANMRMVVGITESARELGITNVAVSTEKK
ncbi:biopolymer transporter ExbD [Marinimicrobium sp. ABcell2]|uniref:ExbD/TolR family protein n=1 Tax=Marinimicrobium sp. ABcell2 TaxID=3069751 RepID=UPI0027B50DF6|nr:biopolymer transporter ExbD [Marinimicrobium sp. ABcell2]MDQ2076536.1 biopolymer transporter ExbD [Marinimicrobium sp. ABcell2]